MTHGHIRVTLWKSPVLKGNPNDAFSTYEVNMKHNKLATRSKHAANVKQTNSMHTANTRQTHSKQAVYKPQACGKPAAAACMHL